MNRGKRTFLSVALATCVVVAGASVSASGESKPSAITNPVTFVDDTTYTWSAPKWAITREAMGITSVDQMKPAAVNSGGFVDKAGNLRIIYTTSANVLGKASAYSKDGGETWIVDKDFVFPAGLKEGLGHFAISEAREGGFRGWARDDVGIASLYSADGQTWVADPGYRVTLAALGIAGVDGGAVIKQPDGKYRMYIGDESSYFRTCGSTRPVSTVIRSATSTDQLYVDRGCGLSHRSRIDRALQTPSPCVHRHERRRRRGVSHQQLHRTWSVGVDVIVFLRTIKGRNEFSEYSTDPRGSCLRFWW